MFLKFRWIETQMCLRSLPGRSDSLAYAEVYGLKTCHAGVRIALFSSSPPILLLSPACGSCPSHHSTSAEYSLVR